MIIIGDIRTDAVGETADIIRGGDHRAFVALQLAGNERQFVLFQRVQAVVAFHFDGVAVQQVEGRAGPNVRIHAEILFQQVGGGQHFLENRTRTHQLNLLAVVFTGFEEIHTFQDFFFDAFALRQGGMGVVLVHQCDVEEYVFVVHIHPLQAAVNNHRHFVRESWVVGHAVRNQVGLNLAMAVFVLQTFAVQRRPAGSAAQQEAARMHIACRPGQIADTLEAEHRIINVERNHGETVVRITGRSRNPVGHRTRFVDAFLQNLTVYRFLIEHQLVFILRRVLLAFRIPDAVLAEHAFHTEGTAFVRYNRYDTFADLLVFQQSGQHADKCHCG